MPRVEWGADSGRKILLDHWYPHNAASNPSAHHTYDHYIPALLDLIHSGATEESIIDFLHDREKETMCFPSLGTRRLLPVARKLLALRLQQL